MASCSNPVQTRVGRRCVPTRLRAAVGKARDPRLDWIEGPVGRRRVDAGVGALARAVLGPWTVVRRLEVDLCAEQTRRCARLFSGLVVHGGVAGRLGTAARAPFGATVLGGSRFRIRPAPCVSGGYPSPLHLVEVTFPPAETVTFESVTRSHVTHQQVWTLSDEMDITVADKTWRLRTGDCLAMVLDQRHLQQPDSQAGAIRIRTDHIGPRIEETMMGEHTLVHCSFERDAVTILGIFNEAIANSTAPYDYKPRSPQSMVSWFDAKRNGNFPVIGVEASDGELLAFARLSQWGASFGTARISPLRRSPAGETQL